MDFKGRVRYAGFEYWRLRAFCLLRVLILFERFNLMAESMYLLADTLDFGAYRLWGGMAFESYLCLFYNCCAEILDC